MAEEHPQTRKPRIVFRILRWFGLSILLLLLITGLVFRAPWKVNSLLLIILAACTVLPRPFRKWFWLSVGLTIIALIVWVFMPDNTEGWRPYTFDKELAALEAKRAIPDSENAAVIYKKLFADIDSNSIHPSFLNANTAGLAETQPWSSKDHPELANWLKEKQPVVVSLMEIAQLKQCRFPLDANMWDNKGMDRLPKMRHFSTFLSLAANYDIGDGRTDSGIKKYMALLQISDHLYQQPPLIDKLTGMAIEALAFYDIKNFVVTSNAVAEHLHSIENTVASAQHIWAKDWPDTFEYEKILQKNMTCSLMYEMNETGRSRLSPCPGLLLMKSYLKKNLPITYWRIKSLKIGSIPSWFYMPSTPRKAGEIIDASYEKYRAMADPKFDWKLAPQPQELPSSNWRTMTNFSLLTKTLTELACEGYPKIHDSYLRVAAEQRGCSIIIALRKYKNQNGRWPEGLDQIKTLVAEDSLVDPINNGQFIYKIEGDNFRLYSKGKNNIDENGERGTSDDKKTDKDDWLIWPEYEKSSKAKISNAQTGEKHAK